MIISKEKSSKLLSHATQIFVGGFFIYTAYSKILRPDTFINTIREYQMLPDPLNAVMGLVLPWVEVIAGVAVIVGIWRKPALILVIAMLVIFIIALAQAHFRGFEINCGCYGDDPDKKTDLIKQILIDVMLLLLTLWLCLKYFYAEKVLGKAK